MCGAASAILRLHRKLNNAFLVAALDHAFDCRAKPVNRGGEGVTPMTALRPDIDPDGRHAVRCGKCYSLLYWTGYEGKIRIPYGTLLDEPALIREPVREISFVDAVDALSGRGNLHPRV